MGSSVAGDVVVCRFPFSDLSSYKKRPALVISGPFGDDYLLCQITSSSAHHSVELKNEDFMQGSLRKPVSYIRPEKLFTADQSVIDYSAGKISPDIMKNVRAAIKYAHNL